MRLGDLKPASGSKKGKKRVGRGRSSGLGKTSGRGHKGQNQRSGGKTPPGFEGGQMPLQRRVPKRGFRNIFRKEYAIVNVGNLNIFDDGEVVDIPFLVRSGLVNNLKSGVKLLGKGDIKKKLIVKVNKASASAVEKINAAGGSVEVS
jgi:large subunit ribosomal protein L15